MKKYQKRYVFEVILSGILLLLMAFVLIFSAFYRKNAEKNMEKRSLWYDADNVFVMVETSDRLVGVFHGPEVVEYADATLSTLITEGHVPDTMNWDQLRKLIRVDLKTEIPGDTPCYIYDKHYEGYRYDTGD